MFGIDSEVNTALDAVFADGPTRYLLLSQTEPVFGASGYTGITEPSAASYSRVELTGAEWAAAVDRATGVDVPFPDTVDDFGVIGWWGLADDPDVGEGVVGWVGRFAKPLTLPAGTSNITLNLRAESPFTFIELA